MSLCWICLRVLFIRIVSSSRTEISTAFISFVLVSLAALLGIYVLGLVVSKILFRLTIGKSALFALGAAFPSAAFFWAFYCRVMFGEKWGVTILSVIIIANLLLVPISLVLLEVPIEHCSRPTHIKRQKQVQQVCTSWRTAQKICTRVMDTIYVKDETREMTVF